MKRETLCQMYDLRININVIEYVGDEAILLAKFRPVVDEIATLF